jgi:hypothetical protein
VIRKRIKGAMLESQEAGRLGGWEVTKEIKILSSLQAS